jgi:hypothetical protein
VSRGSGRVRGVDHGSPGLGTSLSLTCHNCSYRKSPEPALKQGGYQTKHCPFSVKLVSAGRLMSVTLAWSVPRVLPPESGADD